MSFFLPSVTSFALLALLKTSFSLLFPSPFFSSWSLSSHFLSSAVIYNLSLHSPTLLPSLSICPTQNLSFSLKLIQLIGRQKAGSSLFPPSVVLSDTTFIIFYCSKRCLSLDPDFSRFWHDRTKGRGWTDRRVHREGEEGLGETEKGRGKKDGNDIRTVYVRRPHSISHLLFTSSVSLFFTDLITLQKTKAITSPTLLMS